MLVHKPGSGADRGGRINARSGAPGAERQTQLTGSGADGLDPEVCALDSTGLAAHP
jgi:hypothetical protein